MHLLTNPLKMEKMGFHCCYFLNVNLYRVLSRGMVDHYFPKNANLVQACPLALHLNIYTRIYKLTEMAEEDNLWSENMSHMCPIN